MLIPFATDKQNLRKTYNYEWNNVENNEEAYDARMVQLHDSTSSSPEKEIKSRNRLGTPPPPPRRGVEKPEGPSALQPTTEYWYNSATRLNPQTWR